MRTKPKTLGILLAGLALTLAPGCSDNDSSDSDGGDATSLDGGTGDGQVTGDGALLGDGGVSTDAYSLPCQGTGEICTDPVDCCSGRCEMNSLGDMVCQPGEGCKGDSEACAVASLSSR